MTQFEMKNEVIETRKSNWFWLRSNLFVFEGNGVDVNFDFDLSREGTIITACNRVKCFVIKDSFHNEDT